MMDGVLVLPEGTMDSRQSIVGGGIEPAIVHTLGKRQNGASDVEGLTDLAAIAEHRGDESQCLGLGKDLSLNNLYMS